MRDNRRAVRLRIGRNVRQIRRLRGLTQERLAELAGNTHKHIGQVERGEVNVTIDILTRIADGLAVPILDLFGTQSSDRRRVFTITDREIDLIERTARALSRVKNAHRRR